MANQILAWVSVFAIIALALAQDDLLQKQPQVVREINNNDGSGNYLFT